MWTHAHPIFIITSFASWSHPWNYFAKFGVYVFIVIAISMTQRIDMCITLLLSDIISISQTAVDRMFVMTSRHGHVFHTVSPLWVPSQRVMQSFAIFFVVRMSKLLNKQSRCRQIETQWRSYDVTAMKLWHFISLKNMRVYTKLHWSRETRICVSTLNIVGSDNSLSHGRRQAIIWTNAGILLTVPWGQNWTAALNAFANSTAIKIHISIKVQLYTQLVESRKCMHRWKAMKCPEMAPVFVYAPASWSMAVFHSKSLLPLRFNGTWWTHWIDLSRA